jgi:hypothetical protein
MDSSKKDLSIFITSITVFDLAETDLGYFVKNEISPKKLPWSSSLMKVCVLLSKRRIEPLVR